MQRNPGLYVLLLLAGLCRAAEPAVVGESLLAPDPLAADPAPGFSSARVQRLEREDAPGRRLLRIEVPRPGSQPWQEQIHVRATGPVSKGQVCLLRFSIRADDDRARVLLYVQRAEHPWTKDLFRWVAADRTWRRYELPLQVSEDRPAGMSMIGLGCAARAQTIELADVSLLACPPGTPIASLPATPNTYAGREADAPWRSAALARINEVRTTTLTVRVRDARGAPVQRAQVRVRQSAHAFAFGTAVPAWAVLGRAADHERFRQVLLRHFNQATLEQELAWGRYQTQADTAHAAVAWLTAHQLPVRGHCLILPSLEPGVDVPAEILALSRKPAELRRRCAERVVAATAALRGQVAQWDVVADPLLYRDLLALIGEDAAVDWFRLARAADPAAKLFLSNRLWPGTGDEALADALADRARGLVEAGAPVDGIGLDWRWHGLFPDPVAVQNTLDRLTRSKLPLAITALGIDACGDDQLQADVLRDLLIVAFANRSVRGISLDGFWAGALWAPNNGLWRRDWQEKPALRVWRDWVEGRWWTDLNAETDADGACTFRVFKGRHAVEAVLPEITHRREAALEAPAVMELRP